MGQRCQRECYRSLLLDGHVRAEQRGSAAGVPEAGLLTLTPWSNCKQRQRGTW